MKEFTKKLFAMILLASIVCGGISLSKPNQAYAKTVSKVTKKFTLTQKNSTVTHELKITEGEKVFVKVKILDVKGKVSKQIMDGSLCFGFYEDSTIGMDAFFSDWTKPKLKRNAFKKGKVLDSSKNEEGLGAIGGDADVDWSMINGLKKLKVEVTYYTESGNVGIESVKKKVYTDF